MTKNSAIIAVVFCALFCALFAASAELSRPAQAAETCTTEDSPGWNWAKCGNHQRGVVTLDGGVYIVGACEFNKMWAHGAIRHIGTTPLPGERIEKLRGDRFARTLTDCPWRIRQSHPYPWHQTPGFWIIKQGY